MKNHMTKLSIARVPTWVDKNRLEGVEIQLGRVNTFWIKGGEKVYGEPESEHITNILKELKMEKDEGVKDEKSTEKQDKKDEQKPEQTKTQTTEKADNEVALLPDVLTPALITKWEKMRTVDRMLMFQRTPRDQIFEKPVGSGQLASYVKGNYMVKEANAAFLFDWKFIHQGISVGSEGVAVYGIIEANVDGITMSRPAVGYEEINKKMTAQLAIKSATTDAIKKGLSLFGFNSDVYSGEV